jgi:hypothetical protein
MQGPARGVRTTGPCRSALCRCRPARTQPWRVNKGRRPTKWLWLSAGVDGHRRLGRCSLERRLGPDPRQLGPSK